MMMIWLPESSAISQEAVLSPSWHTECYKIEMEQSEPDGIRITPKDQASLCTMALLVLWNVTLRLVPAMTLLVELRQFR